MAEAGNVFAGISRAGDSPKLGLSWKENPVVFLGGQDLSFKEKTNTLALWASFHSPSRELTAVSW